LNKNPFFGYLSSRFFDEGYILAVHNKQLKATGLNSLSFRYDNENKIAFTILKNIQKYGRHTKTSKKNIA